METTLSCRSLDSCCWGWIEPSNFRCCCWPTIDRSPDHLLLLPSTTLSHLHHHLHSNYHHNRCLSRSQSPKRTTSGSKSNSAADAKEGPTTVNAKGFAARPRTSTNHPSTVLSSVSPTVRSSAKSRIPSLMDIDCTVRIVSNTLRFLQKTCADFVWTPSVFCLPSIV